MYSLTKKMKDSIFDWSWENLAIFEFEKKMLKSIESSLPWEKSVAFSSSPVFPRSCLCTPFFSKSAQLSLGGVTTKWLPCHTSQSQVKGRRRHQNAAARRNVEILFFLLWQMQAHTGDRYAAKRCVQFR